ncbi:MAG: sulfatase [Phycisphaeraceae bacterium]|nr:sulfatase [Phycisphaeraceae bacterium]
MTAGAVAVGPTSAAIAQATEPPARPNVVFLLVDDLGWADLGCTGSTFYQTPNVDHLAAEGVRFTNAYAACPVCSPTRASILTGRYPARLNLTDWIPGHDHPEAPLVVPQFNQQLPLEEVTIAEVLRDAGYATAAIGKWHLGGKDYFPQHQGFDLNVAGNHMGQPAKGGYYDASLIESMPPGHEGQYLTDALTDEACKWIEANRQRPFFLYMSYYVVHTPIEGKPEKVEKYKALAREDNPQHNPGYAAMVETMDDSVGVIRAKLAELGIADRTIVIFMSDNGGLSHVTSNAPLRDGKGWLYEGGIREPMIVYAPGVTRAGTLEDTQVISTDFFPTILDLLGLPLQLDLHLDGISFAPLLRRTGTLPPRPLFWHYPYYHQTTPAGAVRFGDWKLIEYFEDDRVELYNLADDIGEQNDLSQQNPQKTQELLDTLHQWRQQVDAKMPTVRQTQPEP